MGAHSFEIAHGPTVGCGYQVTDVSPGGRKARDKKGGEKEPRYPTLFRHCPKYCIPPWAAHLKLP